jgi:hypothetical protein
MKILGVVRLGRILELLTGEYQRIITVILLMKI